MRNKFSKLMIAAAAVVTATAANAEVRITEFMYQGANSGDREFFELTNISDSAIDITGWSYNDSNAADPVSFGSTFGMLAANESIILTELSANAFRSYWGLDASVRIFSIGGDSNLGGSDTIRIFNSATQSAATLIDSVAYSGTTRGISRNRPVGVSGVVVNADFVNSAAGDIYGSALAPTLPDRDLANPGHFPLAAVPEPASWAMMIGGFALAGGAMRRRRVLVAA